MWQHVLYGVIRWWVIVQWVQFGLGASLYSRGDPCVYPPLAVCVSACSLLPSNLELHIQPAGGW